MQYNWKKNTVSFLASQAVSIFGSSLVQYAITWHITLSTQSGVYATLAIVCGFVPMFLLSPFAGVWADRYNRKLLIVLSDGGIAVSTLILAFLFLAGHDYIWLMLVVLAIRGVGSAIQSPCVSAMLPDMVPTEHLTRVNGIYSSLSSFITLLSPMLSAALLGVVELEYIFFIDVVTAVIGIGMLLLFFKLPEAAPKPVQAAANYFREMKEGLAYIGKTRYMKHFLGFMMVFCFMAAPVAFLTPLQVARNYSGGEWQLSAIEVAFSVGMIAGGLIISAWGGMKNRVYTMAMGFGVMALATIALGFRMPFFLYIVFMGVGGLAMPLFNTPGTVVLQERVDPAYIGRVFGIVTMVNTSLMPLGMLVFGPLADVVPIEWLLTGTGIVMAALAVLLARDKPLLEAGAPLKTPARETA